MHERLTLLGKLNNYFPKWSQKLKEPALTKESLHDSLESRLSLKCVCLGLSAFSMTERDEARKALNELKEADLDLKVLTGEMTRQYLKSRILAGSYLDSLLEQTQGGVTCQWLAEVTESNLRSVRTFIIKHVNRM